jgi:hypothetical protein
MGFTVRVPSASSASLPQQPHPHRACFPPAHRPPHPHKQVRAQATVGPPGWSAPRSHPPSTRLWRWRWAACHLALASLFLMMQPTSTLQARHAQVSRAPPLVLDCAPRASSPSSLCGVNRCAVPHHNLCGPSTSKTQLMSLDMTRPIRRTRACRVALPSAAWELPARRFQGYFSRVECVHVAGAEGTHHRRLEQRPPRVRRDDQVVHAHLVQQQLSADPAAFCCQGRSGVHCDTVGRCYPAHQKQRLQTDSTSQQPDSEALWLGNNTLPVFLYLGEEELHQEFDRPLLPGARGELVSVFFVVLHTVDEQPCKRSPNHCSLTTPTSAPLRQRIRATAGAWG